MAENVYETPKSNVLNEIAVEPTTKIKVWGTVRVLVSALIYRGMYNSAGVFSETFTSFGSKLPAYTEFVISIKITYIYLAIFSFTFIVFWIVLIFNRLWAAYIIKATKYNFYITLVMFGLFMVGMYLPIFNLGKVV